MDVFAARVRKGPSPALALWGVAVFAARVRKRSDEVLRLTLDLPLDPLGAGVLKRGNGEAIFPARSVT